MPSRSGLSIVFVSEVPFLRAPWYVVRKYSNTPNERNEMEEARKLTFRERRALRKARRKVRNAKIRAKIAASVYALLDRVQELVHPVPLFHLLMVCGFIFAFLGVLLNFSIVAALGSVAALCGFLVKTLKARRARQVNPASSPEASEHQDGAKQAKEPITAK